MVCMRRYEFGDPARVLEMRGEDCTHCKSLAPWSMGGKSVLICENRQAPEKKCKNAPQSRCHLWRHQQQDKCQ